MTTAAPQVPSESTVGPYHLLRVLGEGGFGVVYLAERREPFVQAVALKVLKAGMDSPSMAARFELERQALALMDHPNLARVLDGGVTETGSRLGAGRPYFVMELVAGRPIDEFCRESVLDIRHRLELFMPVCEAVHHAHTKGVIHRDLKPSNILVGQGGESATSAAIPKVIDFGVAKTLDGAAVQSFTMTGQGLFVGTPEYMSPEQATGSGAGRDIDTRTDVYSLGVVLYQLLTGVLPMDREQLWSRGDVLAMMQYIREVEPPKPSTRAAALKNGTTGTGATSSLGEPEWLARRLRGDLDWIVMRAMEKDRERRYASAADLAADIRRHLKDEPVEAGPPSRAYRASKFVRRNRVFVAASAVSAAAVLGGLIAAVYGLREAQAQRDVAVAARDSERRERMVTKSANDFILSAIGRAKAEHGRAISVLEMAKTMADQIEDGAIAASPGTRVKVRAMLGEMYLSLDEAAKARAQLDAAAQEADPDDPEFAKDRRRIAALLARSEVDSGRFDAALARLRPLRPVLRNSVDKDDRNLLADVQFTRSLALAGLGRHKDAEEAVNDAGELWDEVRGPKSLEAARGMSGLVLVLMKDPASRAEALKVAEDAVALNREISDRGVSTGNALTNLGRVQTEMGNLDGAIESFSEALEIAEMHESTPPLDLSILHLNLCQAFTETGRLPEAQAMADAAIKVRRQHAPGSPALRDALAVAGVVALEQNDAARAETLFRESLDLARNPDAPSPTAEASALTGIADALNRMGKHADAEPLAAKALPIREAKLSPKDWRLSSTRSVLGAAKAGLGKTAEAEPLLVNAAETLLADPAISAVRRRPTLERVVDFYERSGKSAEAATWRSRLTGPTGKGL